MASTSRQTKIVEGDDATKQLIIELRRMRSDRVRVGQIASTSPPRTPRQVVDIAAYRTRNNAARPDLQRVHRLRRGAPAAARGEDRPLPQLDGRAEQGGRAVLGRLSIPIAKLSTFADETARRAEDRLEDARTRLQDVGRVRAAAPPRPPAAAAVAARTANARGIVGRRLVADGESAAAV